VSPVAATQVIPFVVLQSLLPAGHFFRHMPVPMSPMQAKPVGHWLSRLHRQIPVAIRCSGS